MEDRTEAAVAAPEEGVPPNDSAETSEVRKPRRRRRGGRGRGRGTGAKAPATEAPQAPAEQPGSAEPEAGPEGATEGQTPKPRRRRSRGRRSSGAKPETAAAAAESDSEPAKAPPKAGTRAKPRASRRGRAAKGEGSAPKAAEEKETPVEEVSLDDRPEAAKPKRRRRRSTTKKAGPETTETAPEPTAPPGKPEETTPGPTRLRRARGTGRRRREEPVVVPRITDKLMVITEHEERDQIAVLEGRELVQHYVTRVGARSMVGNVYLGRVQNVLPGMEAAFVDIGRGRNAVLYAGEVNYSPEDLEGAPPRIEHVLKPGQAILVQVTKDPMGGKGARLSAQISMPGRYLVLVPDADAFGISRRLSDKERRRLKTLAKNLMPEKHGLIVRTAAEGASEEAIAGDLGRLVAEWEAIEKKSKKAKAPAVLYEEPELTVRVVRDLFNDEEFKELATDSPRVHETVAGYLRDVAPDVAEKVRLHDGKLPVFEEFHIVEQIHKALDRKVWLPSGGYLIIERTEAMTVIDVNTGKHVGGSNLEETVVQTNLEAAREVARQLRLRDIGGIIIIDFIDMLLEPNKQKVVDAVKEAMALDKTRSQVFEIGPLGLLEVTRKRVSGGLLESYSENCPTCEGRGILVNYEA